MLANKFKDFPLINTLSKIPTVSTTILFVCLVCSSEAVTNANLDVETIDKDLWYSSLLLSISGIKEIESSYPSS